MGYVQSYAGGMGMTTTFRLFVYFRVTTLQGGSIEPVKVPLGLYNNARANHGEMQRLVAHAAWCALWETAVTDKFQGRREPEHLSMLKNLCRKLGKDVVRQKFFEGIVFEEMKL